MKPYYPAANKDERLLQRRVADAVNAARQKGACHFLGFFSDRQQELARAELHRQNWNLFAFSGGNEGAERMMLCVFADDEQAVFPIAPLQMSFCGAGRALTHRDYLGAVLALGVAREGVGDIQAGHEGAVLYVQDKLVPFLCDNLIQVGSRLVKTFVAQSGEPAVPYAPEPGGASVASLRLDAVLAAVLRQNRKEAAMRIARQEVQVNHRVVTAGHLPLQEGDLLSVRGEGRFRLTAANQRSKKNRVLIEFLKY